MKHFFVRIYDFFYRHKLGLYSLFGACTVVFGYFATQLTISTNIQSMLPESHSKNDHSSILRNNKSLDKLICTVSLIDSQRVDPDALAIYADAFAAQLRNNDQYHLIDSIQLKQDEQVMMKTIAAVQQNIPFLLDTPDYILLDKKLSPDSIQFTLRKNYQTLATPSGIAMKYLLAKDPLGIANAAFKKLNALQQDESTELYDGYIISSNHKHLTFFIRTSYPSSDARKNEQLNDLLEKTASDLSINNELKPIRCVYFGGQLVAAGNAHQMRVDTYITLSITLILLLLLFFSFFRNLYAPLQVMVPVLFGGLFSMAMMYWIKGEVSAMALGASSVILGIAVNYSLHFLSHYRHSGQIRETIAELVEPMTIGGFTTIAAFFSLCLVNAPVLQQMGLFAAFSLIGSSLSTLIFLPHFVSRSPANTTSNWLDKLAHYQPNKNKWVVTGVIGITLILSLFIHRVSFTEDMMSMNYMTDQQKKAQAEINRVHAESLNTLFCVNEGRSLNEALTKNKESIPTLEQLKQHKQINKFAAISSYLLTPEEVARKRQLWNQFWTTEKKQQVWDNAGSAAQDLGFTSSFIAPLRDQLNQPYLQPDSSYQALFKGFFREFMIEQSDKVILLSPIKTHQENRAAVYSAFKESKNSYITDRQLVTTSLVALVKEDFYKIVYYTSFLVFFTILLSYGRIELSLISFIPMLLTWICILGLMGLFGIEFNIINVIISTLIFGLGDDYSIFITDGLLEKYKYGKSKIDAIKTSIYLSAITTIIGLGTLLFAKHPALRSIAAVSVIGILSILFISQTIQPLLFNFFIQNRADQKRQPFTLWSFAKTVFAFTYYVLGCVLVTLIGFILIKGIPIAKDKMKYAYHVVICKMMWSLLYIMGNVKKNIINKQDDQFQQPAIFIANHSSFLDLLRIISLHPKILLMTNQWVWRSPVFGALVRLADYYPVEEGAEFSVTRLQYWVDRGYSIAIFPEGTRSYTDQIARFKKGAFYLAEKLNLDIIPIVFHGIGHTMSKGDFLLKDGEINIKFLPRISPNDSRYGNSYSEKAKLIGRYFREEYEALKRVQETPKYFYSSLIHNYKFKGASLEWYAKIKIRVEDYYRTIDELVPRSGDILNMGCGYGFLDYMLMFRSSERRLTGIDYDSEKIELANHNYSKNDRIDFICSDIDDWDLPKTYSCILIMDVLHYLPKEKQERVLHKCWQALSDHGVLIIRDGMRDLKTKHKGTLLSEWFSTKIFRFNKTENKLYFPSTDEIKQFAMQHQLSFEVVNDTQLSSNLIMVMRK